MFVNGNLIGFGMVVASALIIALPMYLLRLPDAVAMSSVGLVLIVLDLGLRCRSLGKPKWLTASTMGGYLFFLPVWIFGIGVIILNLVNALLIKK